MDISWVVQTLSNQITLEGLQYSRFCFVLFSILNGSYFTGTLRISFKVYPKG